MFKAINQSITAKVSLLTGGLIVLAVIAFSVIFIYSESRDLKSETTRAATIFATYSTAAVFDDYSSFYQRSDPSDFQKFQQKIKDILRSNPDALGIELVAINGKVLMDSQEAFSGRYEGPDRFISDQTMLSLIQSGNFQTRAFISPAADGTSFQDIVPVNAVEGIHVLSMVYSFSYASYYNRLLQIYTQIAVTAGILLVVGLGLPILFIRRTISPLHKLTAAAEQIAAGDYDVKIFIRDEDEIGTLAKTFNLMSANIKTKITELERVIRVTVGRELRMIELKQKIKNMEDERSQTQNPKAPSAGSDSDVR